MKFEDLKPDDYYYAQYYDANSDEYCMVKGTIGNRPNIYIDNQKVYGTFYKYNRSSAVIGIRLATQEEIHWLNMCEKGGIFIPFNEALKTFSYSEPITQTDSEYNNILIKLLTT